MELRGALVHVLVRHHLEAVDVVGEVVWRLVRGQIHHLVLLVVLPAVTCGYLFPEKRLFGDSFPCRCCGLLAQQSLRSQVRIAMREPALVAKLARVPCETVTECRLVHVFCPSQFLFVMSKFAVRFVFAHSC